MKNTSLKFAFLICVCTFAFASTAAAQAPESMYTDIGSKKCKTIKTGQTYSVQSCAGIAGYKLLLEEDDLRQNITVVNPKGKKYSLNFQQTISGNFSYVGEKAEWRVVKKQGKLTPVALIVRLNASENPEDASKTTSYLAVVKITATLVCVTNKIPPDQSQNLKARQAADVAATKPCIE